MVVIATPAEHPIVPCCNGNTHGQAITPVSCVGQNVVSAPMSSVNGQPILTRMRAITLTQGQCATIEWDMHDREGRPVSLTACTDAQDFKVVLRLKEQLSLGNHNPPIEVPATIVGAETGKVAAELSNRATSVPGVYYGEMALISVAAQTSQQPCVIFSNTFSVIINRSTFSSVNQPGGPPSIAEIRLHLRDSAPTESFLLDNLMFDDAEIALAIARPVMYWNEIPPPIDAVYNTQSFPFRYHWLEGICANLFMMVAEQFRRNQFDYSAAGISVNDQNKEVGYERAGQMRWQAYREWVRATKASINLEGCYGEVSSTYKYAAYTDALRIRY
jgi:hypothetical protein